MPDRKYISTALVIVCLIFFCCRKEEKLKLTNQELLTTQNWKIDRLLFQQLPSPVFMDLTEHTFQQCELDNYLIFGSDNSFKYTENNIVCVSPFGLFYNIDGGTWALQGDTTLVISRGFSARLIFHLKRIAQGSMELEQKTKDYFQGDVVYTYLFKAVKK